MPRKSLWLYGVPLPVISPVCYRLGICVTVGPTSYCTVVNAYWIALFSWPRDYHSNASSISQRCDDLASSPRLVMTIETSTSTTCYWINCASDVHRGDLQSPTYKYTYKWNRWNVKDSACSACISRLLDWPLPSISPVHRLCWRWTVSFSNQSRSSTSLHPLTELQI
jgi:hypothetical protein